MAETAEYLVGKIPLPYIFGVDRVSKTLFLNDKETTGYLWDTKIRYWAFNLEINHGYTLKYV